MGSCFVFVAYVGVGFRGRCFGRLLGGNAYEKKSNKDKQCLTCCRALLLKAGKGLGKVDSSLVAELVAFEWCLELLLEMCLWTFPDLRFEARQVGSADSRVRFVCESTALAGYQKKKKKMD